MRPVPAAVLLLALCAVLSMTATRASDLAIVNAKVYASPEATAIPNATVLIHAGRIVAVEPRDRLRIPADVQVFDARGGVLVAGFWNCHVHLVAGGLLEPERLSDQALSRELTRMFSRWGFTTIFDLASTMRSANDIRHRIETGRVTGPRILTVGEPFYPPHGTPVYARPIYREFQLPTAEIKSIAQAVSRVDQQVHEGADGIKLFAGAIVGGREGIIHMSAEEVRAITAEAHKLGRSTFAHPTDAAGVNVAIDNGVDILAHTDPLAGPWTAAFAEKLKAHHVGLIPTLMLFELEPDPRTPVDIAVQQLGAQARAGGDILFGTDAGFIEVYDPSREYQLMARVLSWRAILASLTTAPARRFGLGGTVGYVKPGFLADLTLLDGDPATEPVNLARVRTVLRAGRIIYARASVTPPGLR